MTNEEKAKEMFPFYEDMDDVEIVQTTFKRAGAIEMAEWKEQQMIDKACEWLQDMACYYAYWEHNGDTYEKEVVYDTEKLINDFRNAMKGGEE